MTARPTSRPEPRSGRRWGLAAPWAAMAVVLMVALAVGAGGRSGPETDSQRVHRITSQIRCPTCRGLSAADSDAPPAQAIRDEVLRRVQLGQSDGAIFAYVVSRYGVQILLNPEGGGVAGLVWALPVALGVFAVVGLFVALRRSRIRPGATVTADDRALVDEAMRP